MSETKKVLLIQPPSRAMTHRPPLGLMYVSSCLTKEGIDSDIIDIKAKKSLSVILDMIMERIKNINTDAIGITCLVTEIEIVEEMCMRIRQIKPDSLIVLGGAHPSTHPEHFSEARKYIDYFVIGEGEITFPELIKTIRRTNNNREEIKKISGLAWFEADEVKRSNPRDLIDLDSIPLPAYDRVDMEYYIRPTSWGSRPILLSLFWLFSSRGCPYQCRFCVAHAVFGRKIRQRSPKNVVDEIEFLVKKYKIDAVYFYDESFTVNNKRVIDICDEMRKRNLRIVFGCQTRVNLISDEVVRKMADSGCLQIDFGIESGSNRILSLIQKGITVEQVRNAVRICKRYGIRIFANMMVNLPDETREDLNSSIQLMKELNCNVVIWNVTVPYPGTFPDLDKELSRQDYRKLMGFPSNEAYELLEEKYKFCKYDVPLKELIDRLYNIFPHPRYIHLKFNPDYIKRWFLFIDFIFNPKYIMTIIKSKKKLQYLNSFIFQERHS